MSGRKWTEEEIAYMQTHYADTRTEDLMAALSREERSIYLCARKLGLHKTREYFEKYVGFPKGHDISTETRFTKGHIPHNKGKKGWKSGGNSEKGRFKKGRRPPNWVPVGSIRKTYDGIYQRKISDTGYPPRDWQSLHSLLWEEYNGPVPKGFLVVFKNKDATDIRIENLECITRAELMRRNSVHNLPEPLAEVVRICGVLNRHINKKSGGRHEKQD